MPAEPETLFKLSITPLTDAEKAEDARWEKSDKKSSDSSPDALKVITPVLEIGALAAGVCGPAGKVVGAVISSVVAIISAVKPGDPSLTVEELRKVILAINKQERAKLFIDAATAFDDFVTTHKDDLQFKSDHDMEWFTTNIIPFLIDLTESKSELSKSLNVLKDDATAWDNPNARLAIVNCVSRHLCAYSLLCRIYAALALSANDAGKDSEYENHKRSFDANINAMSSIVDTRTSGLNEIMETAKTNRIAQFKGPVNKSAAMGGSPIPAENVFFAVVDEYTGTSKDFASGATGGGIVTAEKNRRAEAQDYYDKNKPLLEAHVDRSLRTTRALMSVWKTTVDITKGYILPSVSGAPEFKDGQVIKATKATPKVLRWEKTDSTESTTFLNPNFISFAYKLSGPGGDSEMTNWSDWIEVKRPSDGGRELPVIAIDDFNFQGKTKRHVYMKTKTTYANRFPPGTTSTSVDGDERPFERVTEPVKGVYEFGGIKPGELM